MPSKIITEELKKDIKKYYLSRPMTLSEVGNKFNLSNPTIGKILKDIPKYSKAKINNPNLQEDFFKNIDSEEKAYFLGLLISDGNVIEKDNNGRQASISITLKSNDEYLLQKFKDCVKVNTSISHDGRGCSQIAVRSDIMAFDLVKYGVIPRKSYFTYLPIIDNKYMNHLIRGIFDGDGSIQASMGKNNRFLHSFSFCGSHKLMEDLSNYLSATLNLKTIPQVYEYQDKNLSDIKLQNHSDMYKFGEWLYKDATIYMIRKKDKYNNFKKYFGYENTEITK